MKTLALTSPAKVRGEPVSYGGIVPNQPERPVAEVAKETAHPSGVVAVVYGEPVPILIMTTAGGTDTALPFKEGVVLINSHPVAAPQPCLPRRPLPFLGMRRKPPLVDIQAVRTSSRVSRVSLALLRCSAGLAVALHTACSWSPLQHVEVGKRLRFLARRTTFHCVVVWTYHRTAA